MQIGETWAYREKAYTEGAPVLPVEILQLGPRRSQKVRIRFLEGEYPGLDQWVPAVRLRVPWDEAGAWLEDEKRFAAARDAFPDAFDTLERLAAWEVTGDYPQPDGILVGFSPGEGATVTIADIERVASDLGLDLQELLDEPLAFVNRFGKYVAPWPTALRLDAEANIVGNSRRLAAHREVERVRSSGRPGRLQVEHVPIANVTDILPGFAFPAVCSRPGSSSIAVVVRGMAGVERLSPLASHGSSLTGMVLPACFACFWWNSTQIP